MDISTIITVITYTPVIVKTVSVGIVILQGYSWVSWGIGLFR